MYTKHLSDEVCEVGEEAATGAQVAQEDTPHGQQEPPVLVTSQHRAQPREQHHQHVCI